MALSLAAPRLNPCPWGTLGCGWLGSCCDVHFARHAWQDCDRIRPLATEPSRWHNSVSTPLCQRPNPRSRWKNWGFFSKLSWTLDAWGLLVGRHCVSTDKWRKPPIFNRNTSVVVSASDIDEMHSTNPVITGVYSINRGVGSVKRIYSKISGSPNTYIPLTLSLYSFLYCLQTCLRMGVRY